MIWRIPAATVLTFLFSATCIAQQKTLTLEDAIKQAESNYPSLRQRELVAARGEEKLKILDHAAYPQANIVGQATYQSEVTAFNAPGFPAGLGQKPDNYNLGLDLRLPLTQFGILRSRKQLEAAQTGLALSQIELETQRIRETVSNLFGNIILQQENKKILEVRLAELKSQLGKVSVAVENGATLKTSQLILESEILSTRQRIGDIDGTLGGMTRQLSILTASAVDTATTLVLSETDPSPGEINRPELRVFQAQQRLYDAESALVKADNKPVVFVFTQGYIGRPGYNFLNTKIRPYGIAGLGVNWKLNGLLDQSGQQAIVSLNRKIADTQDAAFRLNLESTLAAKQAEIEKFPGIIAKDSEIEAKRKEIAAIMAVQLEQGAVTATEYLTELNALNTAQLNTKLHQVQLAFAKTQYRITKGY